VPVGQAHLTAVRATCREAVGSHVHLLAVASAPQVLEVYEEMAADTALTAAAAAHWMRQLPGGWVGVGGWTDRRTGGGGLAPAPTARPPAALRPCAGSVSRRDAAAAEPALLLVSSERLDAEARGWRLPRGRLLLQQPAVATIEFTPSLARWVTEVGGVDCPQCSHLPLLCRLSGVCLFGDPSLPTCPPSREPATPLPPAPQRGAGHTAAPCCCWCRRLTLAQVNPLLQNCVALLEQSRLSATYAPAGLLWPSPTGRLEVRAQHHISTPTSGCGQAQ